MVIMSSFKPLSTFPLFSRFPPELRLKIWHESLPDLDGITLHSYKKGCWGLRSLPKSEVDLILDQMLVMEEDTIDYDFRHEMLDPVQVELPMAFVNREARSVALSWMRKRGVEMRFDKGRNCHVFEERFDPRRDALFITQNQWDDFCLEPFDRLAQPDLASHTVKSDADLTRIAIPHPTVGTDCSSLAEVFHWFPHLEVLYVVLDLRIDPKIEMLLRKGDRKQAKARMQNQQWVVDDAEENTLVWNGANRRFQWQGGAGLGNTALYRRMEEVAREIRGRLVARQTGSFEIQPVYAVKG